MTEVTWYSPSKRLVKPSSLSLPPALTAGSPSIVPSASNEPLASLSSVLWAIVRASPAVFATRSETSSSEPPNDFALSRASCAGRGIAPGWDASPTTAALLTGS